MEASGHFDALAALFPRAPGIDWKGGWVGSTDGLNVEEYRKIPALAGMELRSHSMQSVTDRHH